MNKQVLEQLDFDEEIVEKARKKTKKILPLQKMLKHMYRRNRWLQADKWKLQNQVKDLQAQVELIKIKLSKKEPQAHS